MKDSDSLSFWNKSVVDGNNYAHNIHAGPAYRALLQFIRDRFVTPDNVRVQVDVIYLEQFVSEVMGSIYGIAKVYPKAIKTENLDAAEAITGLYKFLLLMGRDGASPLTIGLVSKLEGNIVTECELPSVDFRLDDQSANRNSLEWWYIVKEPKQGTYWPYAIRNPRTGRHHFESREEAEQYYPILANNRHYRFTIMNNREFLELQDPMSRLADHLEP